MITPQELEKRTKETKFAKDMEKAFLEVDKVIKEVLDRGNTRVIVPTYMELGSLIYYDDKQDAIAGGINKKRI